MIDMTKFIVHVCVRSAAGLTKVADWLDRVATRLDPHAWTRKHVEDTKQHMAYLEGEDWRRAHADKFDGLPF